MIFFKKKPTTYVDVFEVNFRRYPDLLKIFIDKSILITDFFVSSVESKMFKELKKVSKVSVLDPEIEDIVFCTLIWSMKYSDFSDQETAWFQLIASPIIFARNKEALTEEEANNIMPLQASDVDDDLKTSFFQMMSRIYNKWNKEFDVSELPKYDKLFEAYHSFQAAFISSCLKVYSSVPIYDLCAKAKSIRKKFKKSQFLGIETLAALTSN